MTSQLPNLSQPILQTQELAKSFLGLQALQNFSLAVNANEILGLIGPNGAGKTTSFNLLTGFLVPTAGRFFSKARTLRGDLLRRSPAWV
jgi:branched-chain amino acid transport system ATP-binding protein